MRKLFAVIVIAATASANETSYRSLQSGPNRSGTPLYDRGIHGEGQIIAFLDTGVDYDSCFFAEPNGARPPINTTLDGNNVDLTRRKIIAYNFLTAENPNDPRAYDNTNHGTQTAGVAVGDRGTPVAHDLDDGIAPAAKMIVQDGGYTGGDACSQRPGFGCPVNLTPILEQAYRQGARIHSNSWGDLQGNPFQPPTANYSASSRDIDAFVHAHPDMLVVFNTGNGPRDPRASSVSAPGAAKNTLQVGGSRDDSRITDDDYVSYFSLVGPTRDGRVKPDVIGPAVASMPAGDYDIRTNNCTTVLEAGTSYASPAIAGAAALVRQYFTDGFYPTGMARAADRMNPSAALLKATIIASARSATYISSAVNTFAQPAPSYQQGFGFPVLDDALFFPGDVSKLRVIDVPIASGLQTNESRTIRVNASSRVPLKVVLVWTDPAGVPRSVSDSTSVLVNDLDLRVIDPAGGTRHGNEPLHPGQPDRLNNVEAISIAQPAAGTYTITVSPHRLGSGSLQGYALVIIGDFVELPAGRTRSVRHL